MNERDGETWTEPPGLFDPSLRASQSKHGLIVWIGLRCLSAFTRPLLPTLQPGSPLASASREAAI